MIVATAADIARLREEMTDPSKTPRTDEMEARTYTSAWEAHEAAKSLCRELELSISDVTSQLEALNGKGAAFWQAEFSRAADGRHQMVERCSELRTEVEDLETELRAQVTYAEAARKALEAAHAALGVVRLQYRCPNNGHPRVVLEACETVEKALRNGPETRTPGKCGACNDTGVVEGGNDDREAHPCPKCSGHAIGHLDHDKAETAFNDWHAKRPAGWHLVHQEMKQRDAFISGARWFQNESSQSNVQRAIEHLEMAVTLIPDSGTCDVRAALQWLKGSGHAESNVKGGA